MRIALAHPRLDRRGGAENVVLWMARGLQQRGHEVVVATRRFSTERWSAEDWDGIRVEVLARGPFDGVKRRAARKRGEGRRLRGVVGECDLIVAHNSPAILWATIAARSLRETRVVWYCEEPRARFHWRDVMPTLAEASKHPERFPWLREPLARLIESEAKHDRKGRLEVDRKLDFEAVADLDLILGNSEFTAKSVERVFGVTAAPCILGMPVPEAVDLAQRAPYVAWITSGLAHKNAHGFLEAIRIAVHELGAHDLAVRAVGLPGEEFGRLLAELGIEQVVRREGWLSDSEINTLVAGCRLLAYPPIDEPFGLVPLHAMAHGRPVLASGIGGPAETVVHEVTGFHADPLDPHDMATRLCELWNAPERCDALGAAGGERYRASFTFDCFLDRFERIVVGERSPV